MISLIVAITTAGHTAFHAVPGLTEAQCARLAGIARAEAHARHPDADAVVVTCTDGGTA